MTVHYAPDVRNGGSGHTAPEGMAAAEWHASAAGDTGTSHTLPGRLYVLQCEWCEDVFLANTKASAMEMFREHEQAQLDEAFMLGLIGAAKRLAGLDPHQQHDPSTFIEHIPEEHRRAFYRRQIGRYLDHELSKPEEAKTNE